LRKKYVLSLDLKLDSESQRINVSGNEFQTVNDLSIYVDSPVHNTELTKQY